MLVLRESKHILPGNTPLLRFSIDLRVWTWANVYLYHDSAVQSPQYSNIEFAAFWFDKLLLCEKVSDK